MAFINSGVTPQAYDNESFLATLSIVMQESQCFGYLVRKASDIACCKRYADAKHAWIFVMGDPAMTPLVFSTNPESKYYNKEFEIATLVHNVVVFALPYGSDLNPEKANERPTVYNKHLKSFVSAVGRAQMVLLEDPEEYA